MGFYVGLDVHSKQTHYCVQDEQGKIVAQGQVATQPDGFRFVVDQCGLLPATPVALESGTQSRFVAQILEKLGMQPRVIDAAEVRAKVHRRGQKNDRRDAYDICDGLRRDQWESRVWIPSQEIDLVRRLLSRRRHFTRQSTRQINAVKFLLRSNGLISPPTLTTALGWSKLLKRPDVEPIADLIGLHMDTWLLSQNIIIKLELKLEDATRPFQSTIDKFKTMFGVGQLVGGGFVAALGQPDRFPTSNHVVSYLGLNPTIYDSGDSKRHGSISRQGCPWMRALLCEAAHQARRDHHPLNPYYRRMAARRGSKAAVTAVAAHLARILWRMWRDDSEFKLEKLNVVCKPSIKTRKYTYQFRKEGVRTTTV